jgi:hypothetical protein
MGGSVEYWLRLKKGGKNMNPMQGNGQEVRVQGIAAPSDWARRRSLASALGRMSVACVLIGVLTMVISFCVDRFHLLSGGSGGEDALLIYIHLARFAGVALAFIGLALGFASVVTSRCAGAKLLSDFKWGLIGTAGCAVIAAYHVRWFVYVIGEMPRH